LARPEAPYDPENCGNQSAAMAKLRPVTIHEILNQLDKTVFTRYAFESLFNDDQGRYIVSITYKDHHAYHFKIVEASSKRWQMIKAPGRLFADPETTYHPDFSDYDSELTDWLARLLEEVTFDSGKSSSFIELMRSNLEKAADSLPNPNQPFNEAEATAWSKKLDDVLAKFAEMQKRDEIQQTELFKLRQEVEEIRELIRKVPKRTWIKSLGNRVLSVAEQIITKAGTEVAQEQIKKLVSMIGNGV
jgi:hypothetical protein